VALDREQGGGPSSPRKRHALGLFAGLPGRYDMLAALLSFGQDPRWRRAMVAAVAASPDDRVLDVATGTGMVAAELVHRYGCRVVGLDQSEEMLAGARAKLAREPRLASRVELVRGEAERLPFADGEFDALTFTYLLRYVDDPAATVAELVRVLRPGGVMASLEFHVPPEPWARAGWFAYTRSAMPLVGWTVSNEWYRTGRFLARSITEFVDRFPLPVQVRWWQEAGMRRVRTKLLSSGAAVVTWAVKSTPVLGEESEDLAHPDG
jgi:demethylmenaquinone methyltransferase / 2-methoxy-6-polyprenyl-1,4-benzoquinol methylase